VAEKLTDWSSLLNKEVPVCHNTTQSGILRARVAAKNAAEWYKGEIRILENK
jgi:hypothetical protein